MRSQKRGSGRARAGVSASGARPARTAENAFEGAHHPLLGKTVGTLVDPQPAGADDLAVRQARFAGATYRPAQLPLPDRISATAALVERGCRWLPAPVSPDGFPKISPIRTPHGSVHRGSHVGASVPWTRTRPRTSIRPSSAHRDRHSPDAKQGSTGGPVRSPTSRSVFPHIPGAPACRVVRTAVSASHIAASSVRGAARQRLDTKRSRVASW